MAEQEKRITCPECGRTVAGYVPSGGDGTALRPRRHNRPGNGTCWGTYTLVDPEASPKVPDLLARLEASLTRGGIRD